MEGTAFRMEQMQKRTTRMNKWKESPFYDRKLKKLVLCRLEKLKLKGDMIGLCKYIAE